MTQIANLRQIDGANTVFAIAKDGVFAWSIAFPQPAGPQTPLLGAATIADGQASTLANLSADLVAQLVTGQPVVGYGIPAGATIAAIASSTSVTISAAATQRGLLVPVTFQPLPLDLTGIDFRFVVRRTMSAADRSILLDLSTSNGLLINGGASGVLSAVVPPTALTKLSQAASPYVAQIIATALDGGPVNLMTQSGPATVTVIEGLA